MELGQVATEVLIKGGMSGVQTKMSLNEKKMPDGRGRLTVVGLWGYYILKPPSERFDALPENEHLTMRLASLVGITTAEHAMLRLRSGELAYITKRFDRLQKGTKKKLHVEDMCQLTERLTRDKYNGSYEQIGKAIKQFTTYPVLELTRFYQLLVFCYLTGNSDMHLKNFSLMTNENGVVTLTPAYDLLSVTLVLPSDLDETALTLNGKKRNLRKSDFNQFAKTIGLPEINQKAAHRSLRKLPEHLGVLESSFLSEESRQRYSALLAERGDWL
jgi:serine/threonine-protein kinase HipA